MAKCNYKVKPYGKRYTDLSATILAVQYKTLPQAILAALSLHRSYEVVEVYIRPSQFKLLTIHDDGHDVPNWVDINNLRKMNRNHPRGNVWRKYSRLVALVEQYILKFTARAKELRAATEAMRVA